MLLREDNDICNATRTWETHAVATASRTERLDFRVPADQKRLIEQAAALSGLTVSSFILGSTVEHAREVVKGASLIELSNRDRDHLLAALNDFDARPNPALRRAAKLHKNMLG
jgi:uncharacterized protein (DUF1778 family)